MMTIGANNPVSSLIDIKFVPSRYTNLAMTTSIDLDEIIKALAHPVRREMLQWLKDPEKYFVEQDHPFEIGVCAGKFDQRCGLSQSTVSAHLATLQRAGLVTSRKVGQWNFFKRNEAVIAEFLRQMSDEL